MPLSVSLPAATALWQTIMDYADACEAQSEAGLAGAELEDAEGATRRAENALVAAFEAATGFVPAYDETAERWTVAYQLGARRRGPNA